MLACSCSAALLNFPEEEDTPEAVAAAEVVVAKLRVQGWRPHAEGGPAPHAIPVRPGASAHAASAGPPRQRNSSGSSAGTSPSKRKLKQQQAGSATVAAAAPAATEPAAEEEQQQQGDSSAAADPSSSVDLDIPEWWPDEEDSDPDWYSDIDDIDDPDWEGWQDSQQQQLQQQQQGQAQQQQGQKPQKQQQRQKQLVKVDSLFFDPFKHSSSNLALAASQAMRLAEEVAAAYAGMADAAELVNSEFVNRDNFFQ
jgi:hypothetical protein